MKVNNGRAIKKYLNDFGILLDDEKMFDTYTPVEWHNFIMDGKLKVLPNHISKNVDNWITIMRHVVLIRHGMTKRSDILKINKKFLVDNKLTTIRLKISAKTYEILNTCFPELKILPWELAMTGTDVFKSDENKVLSIDWYFTKYEFEIDDPLFLEDRVMNLVSIRGFAGLPHTHFNSSCEMFEWYFKQKDIVFSIHNLSKKPTGYWSSMENLKIQIKMYVDYLFENNMIKNPKNDIPYYFSSLNMQGTKYAGIVSTNLKYGHSDNLMELVSTLYPSFNLDISDNRIFGIDNTSILNSLEEKKVFDYIYRDLGIKEIVATGFIKDRKDFYNEYYKESYCPDFIITNIVDKPIIIEYFGWYNPDNRGRHIMFSNYIDKTHRKNDYFNNRKDIYYIDLYPTDLKNNMINIREKVSKILSLKGGEI